MRAIVAISDLRRLKLGKMGSKMGAVSPSLSYEPGISIGFAEACTSQSRMEDNHSER